MVETEQSRPTMPRSRTRLPRLPRWSLPLLLAAAAGLAAWVARTDIELYRCQLALDDMEFHQADRLARSVLARDPDLRPALLLAARAAAGLRDTTRALRLLEHYPDDDSPSAIDARIQAGDLLMNRQHQMSAALQQYQRAVQLDPQHPLANDRLAYLLSVASRRWEAISPRITLCRQNGFTLLHLQMLAVGNESRVEPEIIRRFHQSHPNDPAPLISLAVIARADQDLERAEQLLQQAVAAQPDMAEAQSRLASVLLEAGHDDRFLAWFDQLPDSARKHPGVWAAMGRFAVSRNEPQVAARCFWEAIAREPTHQQANYRLGLVLARLGREDDAQVFLEQARRINVYTTRVQATSDSQRLDDLEQVAQLAEELGLVFEAYGWAQWANRAGRKHSQPQTWATNALGRLTHRITTLKPTRTLASANPTSTVNLADLPGPRWPPPPKPLPVPSQLTRVDIRFEDLAPLAGLHFQYKNGSDPDHAGHSRMYEMTGGGAAVIDLDQDGWPDLLLTQGGVFLERDTQADHVDRLFRNIGNGQFQDVTVQAGLDSRGFGQGATVGDFNSDGFPDIVIANIGQNRLLVNNGDGTFSDVTLSASIPGNRWTTSCLLVDLNNDGLPDFYAANYLSGDDLYTRECRQTDAGDQPNSNTVLSLRTSSTMLAGICSPLNFQAAQDQLFLNLGTGRFRNITREAGIQRPAGNSLGIVAADFSGSGRLSLFLANDSVPNFYFHYQGNDDTNLPRFQERALRCGLAVNQDGRPEACMGVATGDADGDGRLDLFVTNFINQSNTLYRKLPRREFFADLTHRSGLHSNSMNLLSWGTQFLDADLDGRLDLLVTSGHVEKPSDNQVAYKMPTQFLHNTGQGRFVELNADRVGQFFSKPVLGRGMARLDWNRDGLDDVLISHIDVPAVLLTRTTRPNNTPHGHYVAIRLRATGTARDAIGTGLTLTVDDHVLYRQQTAGDGYMASNQRQLIFGTGPVTSVGPLVVNWPSGRVDTFEELPIDCELMLVEGHQPMRVPR